MLLACSEPRCEPEAPLCSERCDHCDGLAAMWLSLPLLSLQRRQLGLQLSVQEHFHSQHHLPAPLTITLTIHKKFFQNVGMLQLCNKQL
jgi:hypothetical protein